MFVQSANEIKRLFDSEINNTNPLLLTILSGGIGSIITLIVSAFLTYSRDKKLNKIRNRSYVVAEEIDNLGARLEGYSNPNYKDIRIIETENFTLLDKLVQNGTIGGEKLNYLRLKNTGPAMIIDCSITLVIESNNRDTEIHKVVPLFQCDQELFVFAQSLDNIPHEQLLKQVTIVYRTIANEIIKYVFDIRRKQNKTICRERYYLKTLFGYRLLNATEVEQISWIYINHVRR